MKKWIDNFKNPENKYKPKIRYWIPHGVMSEEGIVKDVKDLYERGFGSIEAVSMTRGLPDSFYTRENMWGSQLWLEKINILLREAKKYGMKVDISNGPGWPIVDITATHGDDISTLYELAYGLKILEPGETYKGALPLPEVIHEEGTMRTVAASMYRINPVGDKVLDFETYQPLPCSGEIEITAPDDAQYALFAFYGRPSMQKYGEFYVMDHFSEVAADSVMDYWEHTILPALSENKDVIENIFCDSLEYRVDLEWTRTYEQDFEAKKGYSILPYLPCLGSETVCMPSNGTYFCREGVVYQPSRNESVYPKTNICCYTFSDSVLAHKVNADFLDMNTYLYCEKHIKRMQQRAEKMGLGIRYQVSYGKTLEMERAALYPAIPENETLGGRFLDRYRSMSGAVHLARKPIYSIESAAEGFNSYGETHEDILWWMKRAYACGINMGVMHGAHYCGYYDGEGNENGLGPTINWPGFEGFTRRTWTNAWNRTLDIKGQRAVWKYMASLQFLLQNPQKVDVAIFSQAFLKAKEGMGDGRFSYNDEATLNHNGYTYEFLSPALLQHKNCTAKNGIIDADGAAYKAFIVNNEAYMDYPSALKIKEFADNGVPVLFIGRKPTRCNMKSDGKSDAELCALINSIPSEFVSNIYIVASVLKKAGILPDVCPKVQAKLYPLHIKVQNCDFYYVYNGNEASMTDARTKYPDLDKEWCMVPYHNILSLKGDGDVYEINAFSGEIKKIDAEHKDGRVEFSADFERDEAKIYGVLSKEQAKALGIVAEAVQNKLPAQTKVLNGFTLSVTEILPPEGRIGTFYESVYAQREPIVLKELKPWKDIDGLYRTCGKGVYKTTLSIDELPQKAELCLENVNDTYWVIVNGETMPFCDPALKVTDITKALKIGENTIEIEVYTTIQNVASLDFLLEEGKKTEPQKVGIWGAVTVKLY